MKRPDGGVWRQQPLGDALERLLKGSLDKSQRQLVTLATEWKLIAGEDIAKFSHPKTIRKTRNEAVLHVAVESGYATFLQHELPQLLERITQFMGGKVVTRIKLEQAVMETALPEARPKKAKVASAAEAITGNEALDKALASLKETLCNK